MNYSQMLKYALHFSRANKLIWVFGFLTTLPAATLVLFPNMQSQPPEERSFILFCECLPLGLVGAVIGLIAAGGLIAIIHEGSSDKRLTFSQAWLRGKAKIVSLLGLFLLSIPIILIGEGILIATAKFPASALLWPALFIGHLLFSAIVGLLITFGNCAIMIDDLRAWDAVWTSLLITRNNFIRLFMIPGVTFFIRSLFTGVLIAILASRLVGSGLPTPLTLDYSTYEELLGTPLISWAAWAIDLILTPLLTIMLTLAYMKITKETSYPTLTDRQTTA